MHSIDFVDLSLNQEKIHTIRQNIYMDVVHMCRFALINSCTKRHKLKILAAVTGIDKKPN
jgi:hypothetical protein